MFTEAAAQAIDFAYRHGGYQLINAGTDGDPEKAHKKVFDHIIGPLNTGKPETLAQIKALFDYSDPRLAMEFLGMPTRQPVGLAAGMDKEGVGVNVLGSIFSEVEVGSACFEKWVGNEGQRIWRLDQDRSVSNFMGFPGSGSRSIGQRLAASVPHYNDRDFLVFGSIGASRPTFERGTVVEDYQKAAADLALHCDALVVNESSPNTERLGVYFADLGHVREVTRGILETRDSFISRRGVLRLPSQPVGVKIPADLINTDAQTASGKYEKLEDWVTTLIDSGVDFITATNTSLDPKLKARLKDPKVSSIKGGLSGRVLKPKAFDVNQHIYEFTDGEIRQVAVGGVEDEFDVWNLISFCNASHVQVLSALVLKETTSLRFIPKIGYGLVRMLATTGIPNLTYLQGSKVPAPYLEKSWTGQRRYNPLGELAY